jgi:hypothetical protein
VVALDPLLQVLGDIVEPRSAGPWSRPWTGVSAARQERSGS